MFILWQKQHITRPTNGIICDQKSFKNITGNLKFRKKSIRVNLKQQDKPATTISAFVSGSTKYMEGNGKEFIVN